MRFIWHEVKTISQADVEIFALMQKRRFSTRYHDISPTDSSSTDVTPIIAI